jgi:glycerophosphoryl diester phosphodiesterase
MKHAFFTGLVSPLHISHRGGAGLYPENTMFAFERAVRVHHTDMLELDVHATADGQIVVVYDDTLDRCIDGSGPLAAHTFAELSKLDAGFHFPGARGQGATIPLLKTVLDAFPGLRINVEVKTASAVDPFVALMAREDVLDRLCIGSEQDALGEELVRRLPDACHFFPRDALAAFILPTKAGEPPDDTGRYTVLDMPLHWESVKLFDADLAAVARAHGKWINVWTVDDEADMRQAIADGVGGIMTDRPDVLRRVLASR